MAFGFPAKRRRAALGQESLPPLHLGEESEDNSPRRLVFFRIDEPLA